MVETTNKNKVSEIIDSVKEASFLERKEIRSEEEVINSFLDRINDFKAELHKDSQDLNKMIEKLDTITWFENVNEETLKEINNLIVVAKDLRGVLIRKYVSFNYFRSIGFAKDEIAEFKNTIDFLTESYSDLESVFFSLPKNQDFLEITKKLSAV